MFVNRLGIASGMEAGGENRTLVIWLEARDSAIELHRQGFRFECGYVPSRVGGGWRESNPRHRGPKPRALSTELQPQDRYLAGHRY